MTLINFVRRICPICALVSSAWVILLVLRYFGYNVNESLIALLMGGSAVGISYVLAGKLGGKAAKWWKLAGIPIAFLAAWQLLHFRFGWFALVALAYWLVITAFKNRALKGSQGPTLTPGFEGLALKDPKGEALGSALGSAQIERD